jgi:peptidoglycan/xylan/chitin deacetylase (PgdA/CDA1 family)
VEKGKFVISLDVELLWGVRDVIGIPQYGQNIKGVHEVIPRLLNAFNQYQVKATFAIVGFLFFENKLELLNNLPDKLPNYINKSLSPYLGHFNLVGENFDEDPYHYCLHQIRLIQKYPEMEIGTHTFSHYYCLENGQIISDFKEDISNAQRIANKCGIKLTSLVFPRNQYGDEYLKASAESGIICYRGNEHSWIYKPSSADKENLFRRAIRLMDAYINISGHNCYTNENLKGKYLINIPSSRFLRPYTKKLKVLETLRLNRIKTGMTYAAKNNCTYHLWWHPHNFGINQEENFAFLKKILEHYKNLNSKYKFQSHTMTEIATSLMSN